MNEEDRQLVLLSLALCSRLRPGFDEALSKIAKGLNGKELFDDFKRFNDNVSPGMKQRVIRGRTTGAPEPRPPLDQSTFAEEMKKFIGELEDNYIGANLQIALRKYEEKYLRKTPTEAPKRERPISYGNIPAEEV